MRKDVKCAIISMPYYGIFHGPPHVSYFNFVLLVQGKAMTFSWIQKIWHAHCRCAVPAWCLGIPFWQHESDAQSQWWQSHERVWRSPCSETGWQHRDGITTSANDVGMMHGFTVTRELFVFSFIFQILNNTHKECLLGFLTITIWTLQYANTKIWSRW